MTDQKIWSGQDLAFHIYEDGCNVSMCGRATADTGDTKTPAGPDCEECAEAEAMIQRFRGDDGRKISVHALTAEQSKTGDGWSARIAGGHGVWEARRTSDEALGKLASEMDSQTDGRAWRLQRPMSEDGLRMETRARVVDMIPRLAAEEPSDDIARSAADMSRKWDELVQQAASMGGRRVELWATAGYDRFLVRRADVVLREDGTVLVVDLGG